MSPELVKQAIAVFQEEDAVTLTFSEAERVLEALGGLFLAFSGQKAARGASAPQPAHDLIPYQHYGR